jgi:polyisoprenoid-binding protein YceI
MKVFNLLFTVLFLALASFDMPMEITSYNVDTGESKILWTGRKIGGEHTGSIQVREGKLDMNNGRLTGGSFVIDMATIVNEDLSGEYKAKLEGHLKSDDFFGVAKFPTAQLVITDVKGGKDGRYDITGDLTIKEHTHAITFPATLKAENGRVSADARIVVDRSRYDVRYGSSSFFDNLGDKVIYDDFDLEVSLVAKTAVGK